MVDKQTDLLELLQHIDPSNVRLPRLGLNVGMVLKDSDKRLPTGMIGASETQSRYHAGECFRKWGASPAPLPCHGW